MIESNRQEDRGGFRARKSLGQNFLVDRRVIDGIIDRACIDPSEVVVEIGPGLGALTFPLAGLAHHLVAVEKDARAVCELDRRLPRGSGRNVTLVQADILDFPLEDVSGRFDCKLVVVGNLPYYISKPVLEMLVRKRHVVKRAVMMFQAEVADRLLAEPGEKAYGALTVMVRYRAAPSLVMDVSRDSFRPRPKVASRVVCLDFSLPHPVMAESDTWFDTVVKAAFSHRRKTLFNSLRSSGRDWSRDLISSALADCGIEDSRRAETLGIGEFLCLSERLRT